MKTEKEMKELVKEMKKEFLGKEISLFDLDNGAQTILETEESIYGYLLQSLENHSFGYIVGFNDKMQEQQAIVVDFEIIDKDYFEKLQEDNDYELEIKVKINDIFEI